MRKDKAHIAPQLRSRIQALPQELQDRILDFTLLVEPGVVNVDINYRPPWQIQVNRASRKQAAKHYYSTSTFRVFHNEHIRRPVDEIVSSWLESMTTEHQLLLADVRLDDRLYKPVDLGTVEVKDVRDEEDEREDAVNWVQDVLYTLKQCALGLKSGVLKANYFVVMVCERCGDNQIFEEWANEDENCDFGAIKCDCGYVIRP